MINQNFVIALIGSTNVGKSTLFNRLSIENKRSIIYDYHGVTRDYLYSKATIGGTPCTIMDTPGLENQKKDNFEYIINLANKAHLALIIIDDKLGVTEHDILLCSLLRKINKKYIILANKCEKNFSHNKNYYKLGNVPIISISALHGTGILELESIIHHYKPKALSLKEDSSETKKTESIKVAIIGRPNVGKSTLFNALAQYDRSKVSDIAGTTRDTVDITLNYKNYCFTVFDTAGLRKKSKIDESIEKFSSYTTIHHINMSNIVILLVEPQRALEKQDFNIASYAIKEGKAVLIVCNKFDLVADPITYKQDFLHKIKWNSHLKTCEAIFVSAKNDDIVNKVLNKGLFLYKKWNHMSNTGQLNKWLSNITKITPPHLNDKNHKVIKLKYITQVSTRPPKFKIFCNTPNAIRDSYKLFLKNSLKNTLQLESVPIRIEFVKTTNPYKSN